MNDSRVRETSPTETAEALKCIAEFASDLPHVHFTGEQLDLIVSGTQSEETETPFADGYYLSYVLPALNWWIELAEALSTFQKRGAERARLLPLLNDVLSSYTNAVAEGICYSTHLTGRAPASMELVKRYRLYTRSVCALAQQICSEADLGWLLKQA
jgi:hypothetical protein